MTASLQVLYPISADTNFDYAYYVETHIPMVDQYMGAHIASSLVTKGVAGGPDTPAGFYAVASFTFADQDAMNAAMSSAGPVMEDIPNFTNVKPQILIGEVLA